MPRGTGCQRWAKKATHTHTQTYATGPVPNIMFSMNTAAVTYEYVDRFTANFGAMVTNSTTLGPREAATLCGEHTQPAVWRAECGATGKMRERKFGERF